MAWFRRDNEAKGNRHSVREAYGGMQRLEDVRVKDVPERMNILIPEFRFFYSGNRENAVVVTAYRKGIIFPFSVNLDEIRTLYGYDSVIPLRTKLIERWEQYRDNLIDCMKDSGEPEETVELMKYVTSDDGNIGYKVTGVKRAEEKDGDDGDKES